MNLYHHHHSCKIVNVYSFINYFSYIYIYIYISQVVVAQLVGVGSFLLPTQVRVSSMRHAALCEPNILEILDPPMFSGFRGGGGITVDVESFAP
jgi:hypothetical protein